MKLSRRWSCLEKSSTSPTLASNPSFSFVMMAEIPSRREDNTGTPENIASSTAIGRPSNNDGRTKASSAVIKARPVEDASEQPHTIFHAEFVGAGGDTLAFGTRAGDGKVDVRMARREFG